MQREIKFRGKRLDNGEWVYGAFVPDELEQTHGKMVTWGFIRRYRPNQTVESVEMIEVDRNTVGQFTGLHAKNGKEIYEGDVISIDCYSYEELEDEYYGEVVYSNHLSSFCLRNCEQSDGWIPICELGGSYTTITTLCGNIYDNPELEVSE